MIRMLSSKSVWAFRNPSTSINNIKVCARPQTQVEMVRRHMNLVNLSSILPGLPHLTVKGLFDHCCVCSRLVEGLAILYLTDTVNVEGMERFLLLSGL